eukprot:125560-Pelagomonas_calceolata.AAC.1
MRTVRQGAPVHSYCTTRNDEVAAHKLGQSLMGAGQSDQQLQQRTLSIPCPPAASMHTLVEPRHLYCYSMHLSPHPCILWSSLNNSTATACTSTHQAQPPFSHGTSWTDVAAAAVPPPAAAGTLPWPQAWPPNKASTAAVVAATVHATKGRSKCKGGRGEGGARGLPAPLIIVLVAACMAQKCEVRHLRVSMSRDRRWPIARYRV